MEGGEFNRTFREITMATARPQKEIARCFKLIERMLAKTRIPTPTEATEHPIVAFAKNFAVYLDLPRRWVLFMEYLAKKVTPSSTVDDFSLIHVEKPWESRSRSSIAATVVYIVSRLPKFPMEIDLRKIAFRTGVRASTIMTCYRDMIPAINKLLC